MLRFLWIATKGYRLRPWRSPYLRWRIETYSGIPADSIGFAEFWRFTWKEKMRLFRFLVWVREMRATLIKVG
jgi:hypothetical protein